MLKNQPFGAQLTERCSVSSTAVKLFLDISEFWPTDELGEPRTVNSVYEELKGSDNEVGRNTLRLALDGRLDRGHLSNVGKLMRLATAWAGKDVSFWDLARIEE